MSLRPARHRVTAVVRGPRSGSPPLTSPGRWTLVPAVVCATGTVLASVKGPLSPGPTNDVGPALDPGSAPCILAWHRAGAEPGAARPSHPDPLTDRLQAGHVPVYSAHIPGTNRTDRCLYPRQGATMHQPSPLANGTASYWLA